MLSQVELLKQLKHPSHCLPPVVHLPRRFVPRHFHLDVDERFVGRDLEHLTERRQLEGVLERAVLSEGRFEDELRMPLSVVGVSRSAEVDFAVIASMNNHKLIVGR